MGLQNFDIEGDNVGVINALEGEWDTPWEINCIIRDTELDLHRCNVVRFDHCFRETNSVADLLAKMGTRCVVREDWCQNFPQSLTNLCIRDLT